MRERGGENKKGTLIGAPRINSTRPSMQCVCVWMRRKDVSSLLRDEDCRRRTLRNWLSGVSSPLERSLPSLRDPIQRHLDRIRLPLFVFPLLLLLLLPSLTIPLPLHSPFYHCPRCVVDVGVDLEPTPLLLLLLLYLSIRSY